jgi:hypothetical protein
VVGGEKGEGGWGERHFYIPLENPLLFLMAKSGYMASKI